MALDEFGLNLGGDPSLASAPGTQMMSGPELGTTAMPSLNLAQPPPSQSDQEYLQSLPTMQKIGLALQAFSAGVAGRPSPVNELLQRKRQQDKDNRDELRSTIDFAAKGVGLLDKLDPNSLQHKAVASELSRIHPRLAGLFQAAGEARQEGMRVVRAFKNPLVENTLIERCSGTHGAKFSECVIGISKDKDAMKDIYSKADDSIWSPTTDILEVAVDQAKKQGLLDKYKQADGSFKIPEDAAIKLAEESKLFKPEMIDAMRRNPDRLVRFGVVPTSAAAKAQEAGLSEEARQAERPRAEWSEPYMLNGVLVQKNKTTGKVETAVTRPPAKTEKSITPRQEIRDRETLDAREDLTTNWKVDWKTGNGKEKYTQRYLPGPVQKDNPDYDPQIRGLLSKARRSLYGELPRNEGAAAPKAKPAAAETPKPAAAAPATDTFNLASWEKTKKIHNLTDAELEKRLGRKKPLK